MRWIEACLQRCSVAYKCVPFSLGCPLSLILTLADFLSHSPRSFSPCMQTIRLAWVLCLVLLWKQTDRHTPTRMREVNRRERKIWRFARFCVVDFIWHTTIFSIHLLMLFHLRMGTDKKTGCYDFNWKRMNWNSIFFSPTVCMCAGAREEMSNWVEEGGEGRGAGGQRGLFAKENRFYFLFHISYWLFIFHTTQNSY